MREIRNEARRKALWQRENLSACFSEPPCGVRLLRYQKGEMLVQPLKPLTQFLFLAEGQVKIYDLREDGRAFSIHLSGRHALLGDVEFAGSRRTPFYAEAVQPVLCLAVPFAENRAALQNDPVFLRFVMARLVEKLDLFGRMELTTASVEEKLLLYLSARPDHTLNGIGQALADLHCSRRQLQRVTAVLCARGRLEKLGRGRYRLAEEE